jgi:hypothetical protein
MGARRPGSARDLSANHATLGVPVYRASGAPAEVGVPRWLRAYNTPYAWLKANTPLEPVLDGYLMWWVGKTGVYQE